MIYIYVHSNMLNQYGSTCNCTFDVALPKSCQLRSSRWSPGVSLERSSLIAWFGASNGWERMEQLRDAGSFSIHQWIYCNNPECPKWSFTNTQTVGCVMCVCVCAWLFCGDMNCMLRRWVVSYVKAFFIGAYMGYRIIWILPSCVELLLSKMEPWPSMPPGMDSRIVSLNRICWRNALCFWDAQKISTLFSDKNTYTSGN